MRSIQRLAPLALAMGLMLSMVLPAAAQAPVNLTTLHTVHFQNSWLVRAKGLIWLEFDRLNQAAPVAAFVELFRRPEQIVLSDPRRGLLIRINLRQAAVYKGQEGTDLYGRMTGGDAKPLFPQGWPEGKIPGPEFFPSVSAGKIEQASRARLASEPCPAGSTGVPLGEYVECRQSTAGQAPGTPAGQPAAAAPAALTISDAQLVRSVEFGGSVLVRMQGRWWGEVNKQSGQIGFAFVEAAYTGTDITLYDQKRRVWMRFNLPERKIYIGAAEKDVKPLYAIAAVSDQSRIAGSTVSWVTQTPPTTLLESGSASYDTNARQRRLREPCASGQIGFPTGFGAISSSYKLCSPPELSVVYQCKMLPEDTADRKYFCTGIAYDPVVAATYRSCPTNFDYQTGQCRAKQAAAPTTPAPMATPAPAAKPTVTGRTVRMIDNGSIAWVQLKDGQWAEVVKSTGKISFVFEVQGRSDDEVQFIDRKRSILLRTNLKENKVYFGTAAEKTATQFLGSIAATSNESRISGSSVAWETQCPPKELVVVLSGQLSLGSVACPP